MEVKFINNEGLGDYLKKKNDKSKIINLYSNVID